jgi:hypothetical protein
MPMDDLVFFNPFAEIAKSANHLPHWEQPGATYFLTFRLADAIPASLRNRGNSIDRCGCNIIRSLGKMKSRKNTMTGSVAKSSGGLTPNMAPVSCVIRVPVKSLLKA